MITIRPLAAGEGAPLQEVRLREEPFHFGGTTQGAECVWLQYVNDDLAMVHRTYYLALIDWNGRQLHQLETEYYEPEFPEARLWMQQWVEETDEAWHFVMWGQRYPNATAELRAQDRTVSRILRPGAGTGAAVDAQTYILDSCGQFQARCLRMWDAGGDGFAPLHEFLIDEQGRCLYGRWWGPAPERAEPDAVTMRRQGRRYALRWEQIPNRLVRLQG